MLVASLLLCLLTEAAASSFRYDFKNGMKVAFEVGTPGQQIIFQFEPFVVNNSNTNVVVTNSPINGFDYRKSATFVYGSREGISTFGNDVLTLPNKIRIPSTNLEILPGTMTLRYGRLTFNRGPEGSSFIERLLSGLRGEKTVVFALQSAYDRAASGSIVFGDSAPSLCAKEWLNFRAIDYGTVRFAIPIFSINVGRYTSSQPAPLVFSGAVIALNDRIYEAAIRELGGIMTADQHIKFKCSTKTEIVVQIGPLELRLGPSEYMIERRGECWSTIGISTDAVNFLPARMLNHKCLRYDYLRNLVGISEYVGDEE